MVVLTQLQEDAVQQPLRLFFKAPMAIPSENGDDSPHVATIYQWMVDDF